MDTDFTRANARLPRDAQAEIAPTALRRFAEGFNSKTYATKPWKISHFIHDGFQGQSCGRTLEVLSTPGHTPDAFHCSTVRMGCSLRRYLYPAPIWLFRPETDFDAYVASVKRLAALAPQLKIVLGAHNIPVAEPSVLPRLVTTFESVRAGKVPPQKKRWRENSVHYRRHSFLLKTGAVEAR